MEIVRGPGDAERAFESATRQGEKYFADPAVYVERYLEDPRHVEVQVLADAHGNVIHLGERDCTIQRRHQKLVEETPSPAVDDALRERIGRIAVDAARAAGYRSAGTIEGLLTRRRRVLLHGDEHAHPGRAHGHRGGDGARSRARAGSRRRGRAAVARAGGRRASRARDRVPDQRRGRREGVSARAGADHRVSRAGGAGSPRRLGDRGGRRDQRALRPDDREADRPRRRSRAARSPACCARSPSSGSRARRRSSASTARSSSIRASSPARRATASSSRRSWRRRAQELEETVLSSDNKRGTGVGRRRADRPAARRRRGRRARVRRPAPRDRAAVGRHWRGGGARVRGTQAARPGTAPS